MGEVYLSVAKLHASTHMHSQAQPSPPALLGRFEDGRYKAFMTEISEFIPDARQYTDPVRTFAYGTDASFYRLNPKMVVKVRMHPNTEVLIPCVVHRPCASPWYLLSFV
eukprot:126986-Chlamydomonas_euryale.AAC.6